MKRALKITGMLLLGILTILVVFFLVMYRSTRGEYSVPKTAEQDNSIPHIELDHVIFHAETFGNDSNKTVLIIHGGPGNDYKYLLPLKDLSDNYFVVFYDQRGTGLSPRVNPEEHSLENSLADLANIIDHYAPGEKVNLIGHSWGAMLASGYLAKNPERIDKAILAEPGMLTNEKAKEYMEKFQVKPSWKMIKAMLIIAFESLHLKDADKQARIDYIFGRVGLLDIEGNPMRNYFCNKEIKTGYIPFWRFSGVASKAIIRGGMDEQGNIQIDLVTGLEDYSKKVLFVTGECSQIIGKEFQEGHMKYFPNAKMAVIKNAGHTMFGEKPVESIALIEHYFGEE
jgi:proline iminopeptidase